MHTGRPRANPRPRDDAEGTATRSRAKDAGDTRQEAKDGQSGNKPPYHRPRASPRPRDDAEGTATRSKAKDAEDTRQEAKDG